MASWGLAPAPVAGNLVLLEPAEPTALRLAELALQAGLPDGADRPHRTDGGITAAYVTPL